MLAHSLGSINMTEDKPYELFQMETALSTNSEIEIDRETKFRRKIVHIEFASIVLVVICLIVSATLAYQERSASALALAVDSSLDIISYIIILWRYNGKNGDSHNKENLTLFLLAFLVFTSSCLVEYDAIYNLVNAIQPRPSQDFILINLLQCVMFLALGIYKIRLSREAKLGKSLFSDGINSIISSLDCLSMSLSMTVFISFPYVWYLDAIFGVVMGLLILLYGLYLFYQSFITRN